MYRYLKIYFWGQDESYGMLNTLELKWTYGMNLTTVYFSMISKGLTETFSEGAKSFFLAWNFFFHDRKFSIFHFSRPKTNFHHFEKWKSKKKKKKKKKKGPLLSFWRFGLYFFNFLPSLLQFFFFSFPSPPFPFFPCLFSPLVRQQKFPSQKSLGEHSAPPACYATDDITCTHILPQNGCFVAN